RRTLRQAAPHSDARLWRAAMRMVFVLAGRWRPNDASGLADKSAMDRLLAGEMHELEAVHDFLLGSAM
ncbi:hypothetical protein ACP3W1_28485, partial [Salmonella enterica]|uniref:hypothetical protein n=1 Tax=Salmonella enterica TaxID=28901 RepID=UPI003CF88F1D